MLNRKSPTCFKLHFATLADRAFRAWCTCAELGKCQDILQHNKMYEQINLS